MSQKQKHSIDDDNNFFNADDSIKRQQAVQSENKYTIRVTLPTGNEKSLSIDVFDSLLQSIKKIYPSFNDARDKIIVTSRPSFTPFLI